MTSSGDWRHGCWAQTLTWSGPTCRLVSRPRPRSSTEPGTRVCGPARHSPTPRRWRAPGSLQLPDAVMRPPAHARRRPVPVRWRLKSDQDRVGSPCRPTSEHRLRMIPRRAPQPRPAPMPGLGARTWWPAPPRPRPARPVPRASLRRRTLTTILRGPPARFSRTTSGMRLAPRMCRPPPRWRHRPARGTEERLRRRLAYHARETRRPVRRMRRRHRLARPVRRMSRTPRLVGPVRRTRRPLRRRRRPGRPSCPRRRSQRVGRRQRRPRCPGRRSRRLGRRTRRTSRSRRQPVPLRQPEHGPRPRPSPGMRQRGRTTGPDPMVRRRTKEDTRLAGPPGPIEHARTRPSMRPTLRLGFK